MLVWVLSAACAPGQIGQHGDEGPMAGSASAGGHVGGRWAGNGAGGSDAANAGRSSERSGAGASGSATGEETAGASGEAGATGEQLAPFPIAEPLPTGGVELTLERIHPGATTISFGVPIASGELADVSSVRVTAGGQPLVARVSETLPDMNAAGQRLGARALRVQLDAGVMSGDTLTIKVSWGGAPAAPSPATTPYADPGTSTLAAATVTTAARSIQSVGGQFALVETSKTQKTLFTGREPRVIARFPDGYLASTGILGPQLAASGLGAANLAGTSFLSQQFGAFVESSIYRESYALNPHPSSVTDELSDYTAWLYDRCATYLGAYLHHGDVGYLRQGYKACAYYSGKIATSGSSAGLFTGKPTPDLKYSHLRGLYAYIALTGDEQAMAAAQAIAAMWLAEPTFVAPYRLGHTAGPTKLWTERHLATALEALVYGYQLGGAAQYLSALKQMIETAYKHVTGNAAALATLNPGVNLPPQNCFIHSGLQQAEKGAADPWCSPWMSAMLVDPLHEYQRLTGDGRVDEIFVRLGRFLRDVGTSYSTNDRFLAPSACDVPSAGKERRRLVPLYGAGVDAAGVRRTYSDGYDYEHCADASLLAAAAMVSLKKLGQFDTTPVGPFGSEGQSLTALHQELLACAARTFADQTLSDRDPKSWTSAELSAGAANPAAFIDQNEIGFPLRVQMPRRKLSWWFNTSILQLGMLSQAAIGIANVQSGFVQPPGC
jgi:hypothetical protein